MTSVGGRIWRLYNIQANLYRFDAMSAPERPPGPGDRHDGPEVIVIAGQQRAEQRTPAHRHARGQLFASTHGLLSVLLDSGIWVVPSTHAVWVPPHHLHGSATHGAIQGYAVYVAEASCAGLPAQPCSMRTSGLLREAVMRVADAPQENRDAALERIAGVILDEIRGMPIDALGLPLPRDPRLRRIAQALVDDPSDERDLDAWAHWAAVGARTLSRRFVAETGFTFTAWRQRARLMRALEMLADAVSVTTIALELGYSTPSTFISLFRRTFGVTPAVYRRRFEAD